MKKYILTFGALLLLYLSAGAQLQVPAPDDAVEPADEQQAEAPEKQSRYNTPSQSYKDERNAIRRGNSYFNDKNYHRALEQYEEALGVNSGSIRGRFNKAVTLLELQSEDNAGTANDPRVMAGALFEEIIPDARLYDSEIAEKAFYNLGNMAFNEQQYDRSIEMYKSALRINPDNRQTRENLRLAQLKKEEQENQDQQQDQQQQQQDQQQQQQDQQQQQQDQQQQQPQPQQMTQSAQQLLQSMQNKENQTRKKVQQQEPQAGGRPNTDKPW